jgi:hypothetical protein
MIPPKHLSSGEGVERRQSMLHGRRSDTPFSAEFTVTLNLLHFRQRVAKYSFRL